MALSTISYGQKVTSAMWNAFVNFANLFFSRVSWTGSFAWTASSGSPAIGDGTLRCWYIKVGALVFCDLQIVIGSTTNKGSGNWMFTLPVAPADAFCPTGVAKANDGSTTYVGAIEPSGSLDIQIGTHGAASLWGTTVPFTWGTGDILRVAFWYWAAP